MFAEPKATAVGANQLADVRWSAVFDDVELTAAEIRELAKEARPLIRSGGRWVELDQADLDAAAAALAERANTTQLTGAEMLRLALGLEGSPLAGGISVEGGGWAADLLAAAADLSGEPAKAPEGFVGELRSYQAEALAWLGFLDSAGIGGCLALDMGLGKTPTMLAHLLAGVRPRSRAGDRAARGRRQLGRRGEAVHARAARGRAPRPRPRRRTTRSPPRSRTPTSSSPPTAPRCATSTRSQGRVGARRPRRGAGDQEPGQRHRAAAAPHPRAHRVALTGTPIENGLGDLWAILDFTNPGLVGPRPQFIASLSGDGENGGAAGGATGRAAAEDALRALNGILVFRRTKAEPDIAAELPDRIDELDHCAMTPEQIGLYQAVLDKLVVATDLPEGEEPRKGQILAAITALKQICNHPAAYQDDDLPLVGRSGKLAAARGDRRRGVRRRASACWCSPTSPSGA